MLLSTEPSHKVHVALSDDTPIAAIVANTKGHDTSPIIRLSNPAYHDRHVFRGLVDRLLHQWSRDSDRSIVFVLQQLQRHNQDELRIFQALGFVPYHETFVYSLPLIPFEKETYKNWRLELVDYASRKRWLYVRNQFSHLFSNPFPMEDHQFHASLRRQRLFYMLSWCDRPIGVLKAHVASGQVLLQEIHVDGDETLLREALSFLQQKFFANFQHIGEIDVMITTLQPDLLYAARQQGAENRHVGYFTMTATVDPSPSY